MREFLYKNSFIRFYSSLSGQRMTLSHNGLVPIIIFTLLAFLGMMFNLPLFGNFVIAIVCASALALFVLCLGYGKRIETTPNNVNILPISHRKKTVWYMLAPFFSLIIGLVVFFIVMLVFFGIESLILYCNGKDIIPLFDFEELAAIREVGLLGGLFCAIYVIICYSVATIAGLTKKKLYKYLTLTAFVVINAIIFLAVSASSPTDGTGEAFIFIYQCSLFTAKSYTLLPGLWALLMCCGLIAAGLLGFAIYLTCKRFSVKKY